MMASSRVAVAAKTLLLEDAAEGLAATNAVGTSAGGDHCLADHGPDLERLLEGGDSVARGLEDGDLLHAEVTALREHVFWYVSNFSGIGNSPAQPNPSGAASCQL
jgi:hypothetical protein